MKTNLAAASGFWCRSLSGPPVPAWGPIVHADQGEGEQFDEPRSGELRLRLSMVSLVSTLALCAFSTRRQSPFVYHHWGC